MPRASTIMIQPFGHGAPRGAEALSIELSLVSVVTATISDCQAVPGLFHDLPCVPWQWHFQAANFQACFTAQQAGSMGPLHIQTMTANVVVMMSAFLPWLQLS